MVTIKRFKNGDTSFIHHRMADKKKYILMKRVAKHGRQAVIVVPAMLKEQLKPGTLTQLTIEVLEEVKDE